MEGTGEATTLQQAIGALQTILASPQVISSISAAQQTTRTGSTETVERRWTACSEATLATLAKNRDQFDSKLPSILDTGAPEAEKG